MTDAMRARVLELVTAELTQHAKSRDPEVKKFGETCLRCIEDAELQVQREASGEPVPASSPFDHLQDHKEKV